MLMIMIMILLLLLLLLLMMMVPELQMSNILHRDTERTLKSVLTPFKVSEAKIAQCYCPAPDEDNGADVKGDNDLHEVGGVRILSGCCCG